MRAQGGLPRWWFGLVGVTGVALILGVLHALWFAPTERTMGTVQRIFYYHVSSAWTAFVAFFINFLACLAYVKTRRPKWDAVAVSAAEVGVIFGTVNLITGPIWAKPVWGIWWTWDARLTSTLVMWLLYVSYLLLRQFAAEHPGPRGGGPPRGGGAAGRAGAPGRGGPLRAQDAGGAGHPVAPGDRGERAGE